MRGGACSFAAGRRFAAARGTAAISRAGLAGRLTSARRGGRLETGEAEAGAADKFGFPTASSFVNLDSLTVTDRRFCLWRTAGTFAAGPAILPKRDSSLNAEIQTSPHHAISSRTAERAIFLPMRSKFVGANGPALFR